MMWLTRTIEVASGSVIPTFEEIPLTGMSGSERPGVEDVDGSRVVTVYGQGGAFEEADGTRYEATAEGSGSQTSELASGTLNGLTITGSVSRAYADGELAYTTEVSVTYDEDGRPAREVQGDPDQPEAAQDIAYAWSCD